MAWTATFTDAVKRDGRWAFTIVYSDGTRKVAREYVVERLDDATVKAQARAEVASLDRVEAGVGKLTIGSGQAIDLAPPSGPVQDPPTPAEIARGAFGQDLAIFGRLDRASRLGLIAVDDKRIGDTRSRLVAAWLDEYLDLL